MSVLVVYTLLDRRSSLHHELTRGRVLKRGRGGSHRQHLAPLCPTFVKPVISKKVS